MSEKIAVCVCALMLTALSLPYAAAGSTEKKGVTYRWVDENGTVHYGDRVPPQYVQKESAVLNSQGVQVGKLDAQKTPAELAEDERRLQVVLRQKQHDSFLMTTYASVADIESLRDERLVTMKAQRTAAEQYVDTLHSRLSLLQTRAMMFKPYNPREEARRMPDDLAQDMVRTLNEMRAQRDALKAKDTEEVALRSQFQADIERFKELRIPRPPR
jgi:hypothetical protein